MCPVQIRPASGPEDSDDVIDALLGCHARIREFTELSLKLAKASPAPGAAKAAAESLLRYFAEALPRHEADEDLSLAPRLRAARAPDNVVQALDVVSKQHPDIDRVIGRIAPLWEAIAKDEGQLAAVAERLAQSTERIAVIWTPHLALEETVVFPAARALLDAKVLAEIRAEMRARRDERF
jgi:hemerythrin-like domain-containing protein